MVGGLAGGALAVGGTAGRQDAGTPVSGVNLEVSPNPVAFDAPFTVRMTGLEPGQAVTLSSVAIDIAGVPWTAEATFTADDQGRVDLSHQAPTAGSYQSVDPMGLVWSAAPEDGRDSFFVSNDAVTPVSFAATVDGAVVAAANVDRQIPVPAERQQSVAEDGLYGHFLLPEGDDPAPAVLVLGGSEGGLYVYPASLLATHGFAALALAYFNYGPLPPTLANSPLEYFGQAIEWLQAQPGVRADRIGVIGASRGGELALLLGATYPELEAVVSYCGSGILQPSFGASLDEVNPAWTYQGTPIPTTWDRATWNDAAIPVERINGPVLLISGGDDRTWPSALYSQVAYDRLRANDHPFDDQHLRYPDAGHFIVPPYLPTTQTLDTWGGTAEANAFASADSWPKILQMLDTRLNR